MSTLIWATIAVAVAIMWGIGIVDIVRRHLGAKKTVAWLLIVLILPVLGTILYWVLREPDAGDLERVEAAQRSQRQSRHDQPSDSTGFGV
jgi:Phospholipase_D-nuclease N-terminal